MESFSTRLMHVIRRLGKTEAERAAKLGYTTRQLDNWEKGQGIVNALERLESAGIIHLNDDSCSCSKQGAEQKYTSN